MFLKVYDDLCDLVLDQYFDDAMSFCVWERDGDGQVPGGDFCLGYLLPAEWTPAQRSPPTVLPEASGQPADSAMGGVSLQRLHK